MNKKKELLVAKKKIISATSKAINDFSMIEKNDQIMICVSGGKDSYTMLDMVIHFQKYGETNFDFVVVNMDQKQPDFPVDVLPKYLNKLTDCRKIADNFLKLKKEEDNFNKRVWAVSNCMKDYEAIMELKKLLNE